MGHWKAVLSVLVLAFSVQTLASDYYSNELIVKYRSDVVRTNAVMEDFYDRLGVTEVQYFDEMLSDFEHLTLDGGTTVDEAIEALSRDPMVEYAEPNYILSLPENEGFTEVANKNNIPGIPCIPGVIEPPLCDPNLKFPCVIPGIDFPPGCDSGGGGSPDRPDLEDPPAKGEPKPDPDLEKAWGLAKVSAPEAWKISSGDEKFVVAVIDTGVDYNHEDLSANLWRNPSPEKNDIVGYDFVHNDGLPYDDQGHGTHTAGTVGAVGMNGKGVSGVIPNVAIMNLKFITKSGQGSMANAIKAIDYAVKNGAKVLSNSWGGRGPTTGALRDAIQRAEEAGVLFIAAAGNNGTDNDRTAIIPASIDLDSIVAVAASDQSDKLARFSNYGKKTVDLAAPGTDVLSTKPNGKYASHSGTSMACPHVAGAAALVWSQNPDWTFADVKKALMDNVDMVAGLAAKTVSGGRLNVLKSLKSRD